MYMMPQGPYCFDVDGNKYIDYIGSWGPAIVGAADDEVNAALHAQIDKGTSFGAPCELEVRLRPGSAHNCLSVASTRNALLVQPSSSSSDFCSLLLICSVAQGAGVCKGFPTGACRKLVVCVHVCRTRWHRR